MQQKSTQKILLFSVAAQKVEKIKALCRNIPAWGKMHRRLLMETVRTSAASQTGLRNGCRNAGGLQSAARPSVSL